MVDVPSASADRSRARCEIDLSPGTPTAPTRGRPPGTSSRGRPGRHRPCPSGEMLQRWPRPDRAVGEGRRAGRVDHDHEDAAVALDRVGDLEVVDVDAELGGQHQDVGDGSGAVLDRDPHLDQLLGPGGTGAHGPAGGGRPLRGRRAASRGPARPPAGAWPRASRSAGRAWRRWPPRCRRRCRARWRAGRRRCGSCRGSPPAASCRRAPCSSPRSAARAMRVAAVRWGTWETTATSVSCSSGSRATTLAPSSARTERTRV